MVKYNFKFDELGKTLQSTNFKFDEMTCHSILYTGCND